MFVGGALSCVNIITQSLYSKSKDEQMHHSKLDFQNG